MYRMLYNGSIILIGATSGSCIWVQCRDLYYINIAKTKKYYKSFPELNYFFNLNPGSVIGIGLALSYLYTGKPLLMNILSK